MMPTDDWFSVQENGWKKKLKTDIVDWILSEDMSKERRIYIDAKMKRELEKFENLKIAAISIIVLRRVFDSFTFLKKEDGA